MRRSKKFWHLKSFVENKARKVVLFSKCGYTAKHDALLNRLIDNETLLVCAVGTDCELWHDIMDELFVGYGEPRNFSMITTWHEDETLEEVVRFAKDYKIEGIDNQNLEIIEI